MKHEVKTNIIAIDGPAGSGKSTTARLVAKRLAFNFLDTGAMYRALTLKALRHEVNLRNESELLMLTKDTEITLFEKNGRSHVLLDGESITKKIRNERVSSSVAIVASFPAIRKWMVQLQRKIGSSGNVVAEGRDIGTVVFPKARLKIFLVASIDERAKRRSRDFSLAGEVADFEKIVHMIKERDEMDSERQISPLKKADDAIEIDTTNLTIEQQVNLIVRIWQEKTINRE